MAVILILVLLSVSVAVVFLLLFIKAVRGGQYDDDYSPAVRILFDSDDASSDNTHNKP